VVNLTKWATENNCCDLSGFISEKSDITKFNRINAGNDAFEPKLIRFYSNESALKRIKSFL